MHFWCGNLKCCSILNNCSALSVRIAYDRLESYIIRCSFSRCIEWEYFQISLLREKIIKVEFIENLSLFLLYSEKSIFLKFLTQKNELIFLNIYSFVELDELYQTMYKYRKKHFYSIFELAVPYLSCSMLAITIWWKIYLY